MGVYSHLLRPALFCLAPEKAHHVSLGALRATLWGPGAWAARSNAGKADPRLAQTLWGRAFAHPVGLAAGLDKNAVAINALASLGFGHVEVGTLTGIGQPGNPQPRCFRLPADQALINRMGFNNDGAPAAAARLNAQYDPAGGKRRPRCVLGINIGKTKAVPVESALDDYCASLRLLAAQADYLVVNVSSPNTPGLRDLQAEAALRPLLQGIRRELDAICTARNLTGDARPPLLLKIAPDLADAGIDSAVDVALECGLNGLIATNTTISRANLATPAEQVTAIGAGGLSGKPLTTRSTQVLARVAKRVDKRVPVIGVGGIMRAEDAWEKIVNGASLVQLYTGFIYQGPSLIRQINRHLAHKISELGLKNISEAIGRDL